MRRNSHVLRASSMQRNSHIEICKENHILRVSPLICEEIHILGIGYNCTTETPQNYIKMNVETVAQPGGAMPPLNLSKVVFEVISRHTTHFQKNIGANRIGPQSSYRAADRNVEAHIAIA